MKFFNPLKKAAALTLILAAGFTATYGQKVPDGVKALERGQADAAIKIFKSITATDSKNSQAFYYLGLTYLAADKVDSAKTAFDKGVEANTIEPLNFVGLGRVQMANGKQSDAQVNFDKALTLSKSKDIKIMLEIGKANFSEQAKNFPNAFKILNQAQGLNPNNAETYLTIGDAYFEQNDGTQALTYYKKAIELDPKMVRAIYGVGRVYNRSQNPDGAKEEFNKALALDPNFAPAYSELGSLYFRAKMYKESAENFKKYLDMSGNSRNARVKYATILFQNYDFANAVSELEKIARVDTLGASLNRLLAYGYFNLGKTTEGFAAMEKIPAGRRTAVDYERIGVVYDSLKNDSGAINNFKLALAKDSSRASLYGKVVNYYNKKKSYPDVIKWLQLKLTRGKSTTPTSDHLEMGYAYYNNKQFVEADSQFAYVTRVLPDKVTPVLWRARSNAALDPDTKTGQAKPFYEATMEKAGKEPEKYKDELVECNQYMAFYYYNKKDYTTSKVYVKKLLELDPKNSTGNSLNNYYIKLAKTPQAPKGGK